MLQSELDEISEAFQEAWNDSFGQEMFYVPFDKGKTISHPIYGDSEEKVYDFDNKKRFMGTFKELNNEEAGELFGKDTNVEAEITLITKELFDQGVLEIDTSALVEITHRSGRTQLYNITKSIGKVQLGNNRIFTRLGVVEHG